MAINLREDNDMSLTMQECIKDPRVERRLMLKELAGQTGQSSFALGSYEADDIMDISHYNLTQLAKFYGVTADYLLGLSEMKNHPNADPANLRLSDDMIDVLKGGWVDTALFGELMSHEDFVKLLGGIGVYVNISAAMQIHNLNAWVEVVRAKYLNEYRREEVDMDLLLSDTVFLPERDQPGSICYR